MPKRYTSSSPRQRRRSYVACKKIHERRSSIGSNSSNYYPGKATKLKSCDINRHYYNNNNKKILLAKTRNNINNTRIALKTIISPDHSSIKLKYNNINNKINVFNGVFGNTKQNGKCTIYKRGRFQKKNNQMFGACLNISKSVKAQCKQIIKKSKKITVLGRKTPRQRVYAIRKTTELVSSPCTNKMKTKKQFYSLLWRNRFRDNINKMVTN